MTRAPRFRYSRWDGSQVGFDLDAEAILEEITDDLLYHGDLHAALRRLMQQGFEDRNGEQLMGMRDLMERLRRRRRDQLEQHDLGGVYEEIAEALREVLDTERAGLDELASEARESGDARRQEITDQVVSERNLQLDMLPPDLSGMVRELQQYEFTSSEARERFDELMDQLRQELAQSYFNQMSGAMAEVNPETMARMKDMLAGLNDLLAMKEAGQDTQPAFEEFMERFGDFFPESPANLDELLELMAQRMAAMQSMLNSMTPEQRAQLQGLSEQLLEDMDLRWQMDQLGGHLQELFPQMGWERKYDFSGQDPLGFAEAAQMLNELGDLDQLEQMLRGAVEPGRAGRGRHRPGPGPPRRRRGSQPRAAHEARAAARGRRAHQQHRGQARADAEGPAQDRPERPVGPVLEAGPRQARTARDRAHRHRPRAHLRHEALRVRRPVQPPHRAHGPQRGPPHRRRHARAPHAGGLRGGADRADGALVHRAHAGPIALDADA